MVERILPNVRFDSRYNRILSALLEDFKYIIKKALKSIDRYEEFAEIRSRIELFFKVAKAMFGLRDVHTTESMRLLRVGGEGFNSVYTLLE